MTMIRGDSEPVTVNVSGYTLSNGDKIIFTVKCSADDPDDDAILQKTITTFSNNSATIKINPADTKEIPFGAYWYDIQMSLQNGDVTTIVCPSRFIIAKEITHGN